jgi:CTP:molybdopterin cytidylyltransferase MocA
LLFDRSLHTMADYGATLVTDRRIGSVILAAGSSSRLGRPKQLLRLDGRPLVGHVQQQLRAAALARYAAVLGSHAEQVAAALAADGCDLLNNPDWPEGIAASIRVATSWARAHQLAGLLLAVCDQPRLSADHVRALVAAHEREGAPVASGYAGTRGIPAIFGAAWYSRLESLAGDRGAAALLRADPSVIVIEWPDGAIDVDTPAAAQKLGLR